MGIPSRKILLVDDDRNFLDGLARGLRQQFDIVTALGGRQGLSALQGAGAFAVIVSDYRMPDMDGISFLQQARQISPRSIPVILTGYGDFELAVSALHQANVYRFLSKPCPLPLLEVTLADCLEQHRLATQERQLLTQLQSANIELSSRNRELERLFQRLTEMNLELDRLSRIDPLTGLLNRRAWVEAAQACEDTATYEGLPLGLIMIDVDYFKHYNDFLGHHQGDECLKRVAHAIVAESHPSDACGRHGGEEFIVAGAHDPAELLAQAERLRQAVWNLAIAHPQSPVADRITISVGCAHGNAGWEHLARQADAALYVAKQQGRNRVCATSADLSFTTHSIRSACKLVR